MSGGNLDTDKVWRYLTFARFVWLLQKKKLWLSRSDLLGDPWEITLTGNQFEHVIRRHPPTTLPLPKVMPETAMERSQRIIKLWRRQTFVNCWSVSEHESHALWRIYCRTNEGVAIQTTLTRLRESVGLLPLYRVTYEIPGSRMQTPTLPDLVSKKRPMFAYEQEVRIVQVNEGKHDADSDDVPLGTTIDWDPAKHIESIRVHPEADYSFMETVITTVGYYAPALNGRVEWSDMNAPPPF